jgi:SOS response regulatory protein OraA/RecX
LHRQGKSQRWVIGQLQAEGLSPEQISSAIEQAHDGADATTLDTAAALRLAQRKHLGRWRRGEADQATVRREYATFARAGFSHTIARTIIQQDMDEE